MPKRKKPKTSPATKSTVPKKTVAVEILKKVYRLVKRSGTPKGKRTAPALDLDKIVAFSRTPEGRAQTIAHIQRHGGPLYETDPKYPDLIVEVSPDGTRRIGLVVDRKFIECIIPTDQDTPTTDHPPMSPDNLGKLTHRLAKSKSRALSAKLTSEITRGFYATTLVANPVNPLRRARIRKP